MSDSTFERYKETLEKTTIHEKLDYKTLLIHALRTVETSILSGETYIIESSIWTLYNLIPESWHDEKFDSEIKECYFMESIDVRPFWCCVKPDLETCRKLNITAFVEEERIHYFKMLKACVNLLERLGVLMRRTPKAWIPGRSGVVPSGETSVR